MTSAWVERRGVCLVLAAPSGAGKSSILRALLQGELGLVASVSVTTRAPRPGEQEGVDYIFVSEAEFARLVEGGELLEHARVFGRGYGTPRRPVLSWLEAGRDVVLDVDWQGWRQLQASLPGDVTGVFILPPSLLELEVRLRRRGSDADEEVARRMEAARGELAHWAEFDHVVINKTFDACLAEVKNILVAATLTPRRHLEAGRLAAEMLG